MLIIRLISPHSFLISFSLVAFSSICWPISVPPTALGLTPCTQAVVKCRNGKTCMFGIFFCVPKCRTVTLMLSSQRATKDKKKAQVSDHYYHLINFKWNN